MIAMINLVRYAKEINDMTLMSLNLFVIFCVLLWFILDEIRWYKILKEYQSNKNKELPLSNTIANSFKEYLNKRYKKENK